MGSRSAYRNLGSKLYDMGIPEVQNIYKEAAKALGYLKDGEPNPSKLFILDKNTPADPKEKNTWIYVAFVVHNLALNEYFKKINAERKISTSLAPIREKVGEFLLLQLPVVRFQSKTE